MFSYSDECQKKKAFRFEKNVAAFSYCGNVRHTCTLANNFETGEAAGSPPVEPRRKPKQQTYNGNLQSFASVEIPKMRNYNYIIHNNRSKRFHKSLDLWPSLIYVSY